MKRILDGYLILMVDDEPAILELMAKTMEHLGARVLRAKSGTDALKLLENAEPNIIVSDIRMADGDGVFLLKEVRSRYGNKPRFVFLSGFGEVNKDEALKMGAQGRYYKPIPMSQFASELRDILKKSREDASD